MPRQCRYFIPGIPQHVITRGVDRQAVFFHEQDYTLYLKALRDAAATNECLIHAYVLMTNQRIRGRTELNDTLRENGHSEQKPIRKTIRQCHANVDTSLRDGDVIAVVLTDV